MVSPEFQFVCYETRISGLDDVILLLLDVAGKVGRDLPADYVGRSPTYANLERKCPRFFPGKKETECY